ncbi:DoxX family protein [[Mycobacterium] nativiensis]|uniref:DoxX family protein n=1 Tax=[Mycobacterium] nativiensis TaxID=2855503 RepID=A0ABU5XRS8_9MYCO|nr:DoxX family protein [Mycolicibacter sp. MYC340]MEB3030677.1 DoxX family protein [Mycolicibacter sp. MYC340]
MSVPTVYLVTIAVTAAVTIAIAIADFIPADFVLANSAQVGVPRSWLPLLGGLKLAGGAGLLIGLAGVPLVGIAAAAGLVAFFIGAVIAHVRAGVLYNIAFPAGYLLLSAASLTILLA